ncbi:MAG: leucine-rich repeat domain-containing protein [Eubacteriales bacterium]
MSNYEFEKVEGGYSLNRYNGDEEKVVIPDTFQGEPVVEIGEDVFNESSICEVLLPNTLKIIRESAFYECTFLEKVEFPEGLLEIQKYSFFRCYSLTNVVLPVSLESVGNKAFFNNGLTQIVALNENTMFHKGAFQDCEDLEEVSVSAWKSLADEQLLRVVPLKFREFFRLEKEEQKEILTFVKRRAYLKKSILEGDVPEGILALLGAKIKFSLEDVNDFLDISVKAERTAITAIFLEYKNKNFTQEEIEAQNQRVELVEMGLALPTFRELSKKWLCKKTEEGITIQGYLKSETNEIIQKSLEDGTKIIDICAENDFSPLEELTLFADLEKLSPDALKGCHTLRKVILPDTLKIVGNGCFNDCTNLESITFPEGMTHLPSEMFSNCKNLKEVQFPHSIISIHKDPTMYGFFYDCTNLEKVVLPPLLTEIQGGMFYGCASLKEVVIPDSVRTIGSYAFNGCKSLPPLILPKSLETVGNGAFKDCDSMINREGYILFHDIIYNYKGTETVIQIPEGVTTISDFAFSGHKEMTTIHLPKSIKMVGGSAFNYCYALQTVTFEDMEDCEVHFDRWAIRDYMDDSDKMSIREITLPAKATYYKNSFEDFTVVTGGILLKDD